MIRLGLRCRRNCRGQPLWEATAIEDSLGREFYATMAASERWRIRELRSQIEGMLYERTLISRKPEEVIKTELSTMREGGAISPDLVFKSPLGLLFYAAGYNEQIQLLQLGYAGIQFIQYYTESPDKELKRLLKASGCPYSFDNIPMTRIGMLANRHFGRNRSMQRRLSGRSAWSRVLLRVSLELLRRSMRQSLLSEFQT